jgi:hypothetical protein
MADDDEKLPLRKMDVLYNDIIGDIKALQDRLEGNTLALQETLEAFRTITNGFLDDVSFRASDLKQSAGLIVISSEKSIEEAARKAEFQINQRLTQAAVEAVGKSAREAAFRAMAEPMKAIKQAYNELAAKATYLQEAVEQAKEGLGLKWYKVFGIAALTLILGGSITIFIARQVEAAIPSVSYDDRKALATGRMLLRIWNDLDPPIQKTILKMGSSTPISPSK